MRVISEYHTGTFSNFYEAFESRFPSPDARLDAARMLVPGPGHELPSPEHLSHNILAARWGEESEVLQGAANFLFRLKAIVNMRRAPMLVFSRGTAEDILDKNEESLSDDVEIDLGVTSQGIYDLGFGGSTRPGAKSRTGLEAPFLSFRVRVPVWRPARIKVDMLEPVCVIEPPESREAMLPVHLGAVSLDPDIQNYHRTKKIAERSVVIGHAACFQVFKALSRKTTGADADDLVKLII